MNTQKQSTPSATQRVRQAVRELATASARTTRLRHGAEHAFDVAKAGTKTAAALAELAAAEAKRAVQTRVDDAVVQTLMGKSK